MIDAKRLKALRALLLLALAAAWPAYGKPLLVPWVPNEGQLHSAVAYQLNSPSFSAYLTHGGQLVYQFPGADGEAAAVLTEELLDGRVELVPGEPAGTRASFFTGADPERWRSNLVTYETIRLPELYPGIAMELALRDGSVEKIFHVAPGAAPEAIRLRLSGQRALALDGEGRLLARTHLGEVGFSAPVAWQDGEDGRRPVEVRWALAGDGSYGFELGAFDAARPLLIDPILQATYVGGSDSEFGSAIEHPNGSIYVTGNTASLDFPGTTGGAQPALAFTPGPAPPSDVFIARISSDLTTLEQATYVGGSGIDTSSILEIADNGDLILGGVTESADFPGTAGGAQATFSGGGFLGGGDAFAFRINPALTTLLQATYLGGSDVDQLLSMRLDGLGSLYFSGVTASTDFPGTAGGAQTSNAGPSFFNGDAFVARVSEDLTTLNQSTYYGGTDVEFSGGLLVTPELIYLSGTTQSTDLPGTSGGAQPGNGGLVDAYVVAFPTSLTSIAQATYYGGAGFDGTPGILGAPGGVYLTGSTQSTNLPGVSGGAQAVYGGGTPTDEVADTFVVLLSAGLSSITQATYLGGSGIDAGFSVRDPANGDILVAGSTTSADFPGVAGGAQAAFAGGVEAGDTFVSRLNAGLTTLLQSTYLGGAGDDFGFVTFASSDGVYVSGSTTSPDFPNVTGGAQEVFGGVGADNTGDGFVALLSADLTTLGQATYYGGSGDDSAAVLSDDGERLLLTGTTTSSDLPGTTGGAQAAFGGVQDQFLATLSSDLASGSGSGGGGNGGGSGGGGAETTGPIFAAALPGQRVFQFPSGTPSTFFGSVTNAGDSTAVDCALAPRTSIQSDFSFQTTDPEDNSLTGEPNDPVDIAAGATQSFLFTFTPTATFPSTTVVIDYDCANTEPAAVSAVNSVDLLSIGTPTPDVVAITLTSTGDGIAHIPGATGAVAVSMATVNVGATGPVTIVAEPSLASGVPGVVTNICETDPGTGLCLGALVPELTLEMTENAAKTFTFVVQGTGVIPLDPANNRMEIKFFVDGADGTQVGQSSFALWTDPI